MVVRGPASVRTELGDRYRDQEPDERNDKGETDKGETSFASCYYLIHYNTPPFFVVGLKTYGLCRIV